MPDSEANLEALERKKSENADVQSASSLAPASSESVSVTSRILTRIHEEVPEPPLQMRATYPLGISRRGWQRSLFYLIISAAVLFFFWRVQSVLPPFIFAFVLAALIDPTLRYMEKKGRPRVQSILTLYLLGLLLVVIAVLLIFPAAQNQIEELSSNFNSYSSVVKKSANLWLSSHINVLKFFGIKQNSVDTLLNSSSSPVQGKISEALGGITSFLQGLPSQAIWLILPVISFFIMKDFQEIRARLIALFPRRMYAPIDEMTKEIVEVFSSYLQGLTKICSLFGVIVFFALWALGVRYALFLGILAGVFYVIPLIGPYIVAAGAGILAYLEPHTALFIIKIPAASFSFAILIALTVVVIQISFDQVVYPRIVGGSVGLHPVISIFALLCGATLFGILGMILAVPVAGAIQILLTRIFPQLIRPAPTTLLTPQSE